MTEAEYLKATNRVKVSAAIVLLNDVVAGEEYAVNPKELSDIMSALRKIESDLFKSFDLDPE